MRKGAGPRPNHSCGCSAAARTGFRRSSCMAILRPGAAAMQGSFWKATADTWKRMDIRDTIISQGSGAAPAGRISAGTLSTPFPKENSMTTASRQCRESSTATGYSPLRTPLTKSIPVIMKSGSSCVSRRKNLFWSLSGRGSTSRSLSGIRGWIKPLIMFSTGVIQRRPVWKTDGTVLPIISMRMQSAHSQWAAGTG